MYKRQVVACVLFQLGIAMTGAQKTAILSTFEPLTSIVLGVVCFGEAVGIKTGIGVAFILALSLIHIWWRWELRNQSA